MPRKYKNQAPLQASIALNLIILYAFTVFTVVALTKHYINPYAPTPTVSARVISAPRSVVRTEPTAAPRAQGVSNKSISDAIANTCKQAYKDHQAKIMEYGLSEGVFVSTCFSDLNGLAYAESRHNPNAHGDIGIGEGSFGIVQINQHFHPGTKDCALDVGCATKYAIDRLVRFGYPKYRTRAIQCWNGCTAQNGYAEAVKRFALMYK